MKKIAITIIMISALLPMVVSCNDSHNDEPVVFIPCVQNELIPNRTDIIWCDSTSWVEYEYPADSVPFVWNVKESHELRARDFVKVYRYRLLAEHINGRDYLRVYRDGKSTGMLVRADSTTLWAYLPDRNIEEIIYSFKENEGYELGYQLNVGLFDGSDNYHNISREITEISIDTTELWISPNIYHNDPILRWSLSFSFYEKSAYYSGKEVNTRVFIDDRRQLFQNHLGFICGDHGLISREPQSQDNPKKFVVDSIIIAGRWEVINNRFVLQPPLCDGWYPKDLTK